MKEWITSFLHKKIIVDFISMVFKPLTCWKGMCLTEIFKIVYSIEWKYKFHILNYLNGGIITNTGDEANEDWKIPQSQIVDEKMI